MRQVTFPDQPLEQRVQAAFGADLTTTTGTWAWETLTCPHPAIPSATISRLTADPVTIKRGVTVGAGQTSTTTGTLRLLNNDGAFTPMLAASPHYPYVDAGTPIRYQVKPQPDMVDVFTRAAVSNGWGTATSGEVWTPVTGHEPNFSTTGTQGRVSHAAANTFYGIRSTYQTRDGEWLFDVTPGQVATGNSLYAGPALRISADSLNLLWVAVELAQSGGVRITYYRATNGSFVFLQSNLIAGFTYTGTTTIRCRVVADGYTIKARAWDATGLEPAVWHLSRVETTVVGRGRAGFYTWRPSGNTNTSLIYTIDNLSVQAWTSRLEGFIADVRPTFNPMAGGQTWSTVQVDVGGVGSRLEKLDAPTWSPMRRSVQNAYETPVAYWPLEDDEGALQAASAFPGGVPMSVTGPAVFGFSQGTPTEQYLSRYGTKPLVSLAAGARLSGVVPPAAVTSEWAVSVMADFFPPGISPVTNLRVFQWDTPSSNINRWALIGLAAGGYVVRAYNDADTSSPYTDVITLGGNFGDLNTYTIEGRQNGGNITVELFCNDVFYTAGSIAGTMGAVTRLTINPDRVNTTASTNPYGIRLVAGHARVVDEISVHDTPYYTPPELSAPVTAASAWFKEPAHRRIERLCQEERVPIVLAGNPGADGMTQLNAQQDGAFVKLITDAAESESGGLLYEDGFGYTYLTRHQRYNQPVALTVDMATYRRSEGTSQEDILVPELDSRSANFWTVTRSRGMSGSYAAPLEYRKRRGTIAEEKTLDVLTDDVVTDHAAWRTHVAVDGQGVNYPNVLLDLAANPEYIQDYLSVVIGSRVQRTNQPTIAGVGAIDQVVEGISETISPTSWLATLDASPAGVWQVGVWDDTGSRYSPSATTLSGSMTTTVLSFTMSGEPWQTGAVDFLFSIDGEHLRVTNISGSGSGPYTCTVSQRSINGRVASHLAGAAVTFANPTRWAL